MSTLLILSIALDPSFKEVASDPGLHLKAEVSSPSDSKASKGWPLAEHGLAFLKEMIEANCFQRKRSLSD